MRATPITGAVEQGTTFKFNWDMVSDDSKDHMYGLVVHISDPTKCGLQSVRTIPPDLPVGDPWLQELEKYAYSVD